ncbi:hypothetical protein HF086_000497 [Spodoptera exigua]|uniref:Uncharacterized protein n=1 Tax=Spodoptera exigua TaxID=7107 RepID=A0A922MRL0_SPOEX|nr:hypothetical protein HF086_000497 [Spodoptera exigua]
MELPSEAWRVKVPHTLHPKSWHPGRHTKEQNVSKNSEGKQNVTWCLFSRKKKKCYEEESPSLLSLANNLNRNCCRCCWIFVKYVKEVFRLFVR